MRLFKMEIYKLYHEKVFLWGVLSVIGLMMIFFWFAEVGDELAVIGEKSYSGYEAVQVNRKITKEFEGIITDEKIDQIIKKYGIPSKLGENMPNWRDGNYLNDFVFVLHRWKLASANTSHANIYAGRIRAWKSV